MKIRLRRMSRLLSVATLSVALFSCADEEIVGGGPRVQEGLPAQIVLKVASGDNRIETRAAQDAANEKRVTNLYVFVFDENGDVCEGSREYHNVPANGVVLTARSKNNAQIAGIANFSETGVNSTYQLSLDALKEVKTKAELEALMAKLDQQTLERSSQFIMSGYAVDGSGNDVFNIPGSESGGIASFECTLKLERLDAKVEFIVKTEVPADKNWDKFDFRPKGWRVVNVPAQSLVLPRETGDADGDGCTYFESPEMPFETIGRDGEYLLDSCAFVFYMPESRKTPARKISGETGVTDAAARYALREKRDKAESKPGEDVSNKPGQEYENGAFTYAPANAAYVEMSGTLSYEEQGGNTVNADVKFTVHLGYANQDPDDYDTRRNTHYIYTVTIRGVNDIEVEVTEKKESRPGYEGNVIVSEIKPHELDAHYDRVLITLNRAQVPRLTWGVQTPYDKAVYKGDFTDANPPGTSSGTGESSTGSGISDYRWIKFAINEDYGRGNNEYVKYPGDQNYKGLPGGGEKSGYDGHSGYPNARLLDVHQLLQRLRDDYDKGLTSGTVTITAFIDEYVYVRHPWDHDYSAGNNYQLKKWREYVGAEDRLLYIIDGDNAHYSPDGASSTMTAIQTFRQKSIRTVYNVDKSESELPTCWGLESSMEGDLVDVGDVSRGKSSGNGRLNTLQCLLGSNYQTVLQWTDVLDVWSTNPEDRYKLKINDALHAVLTRNRDLDGDNIVDPEEIRWYLAAKDQLVDFYIGESALDDASHLYPTNPDDRDGQTYWHYTTSTAYDGGQGGNNVAWGLYAEECVALGATSGMERPELGNKFTYRCVRNLGIGLDAPESEPVALIPRVTAAEADGTYVIDCSNLSPKARRQSIETGNQPQHNDLSPYNRPYAKFRVATRDQDFENAGRERTWSIPAFRWRNWRDWSEYQTMTITPSGYRIPNLRELLIMQTRLPDDAWKSYPGAGLTDNGGGKAMYLSFTSFSRRSTETGGDGTLPNKNGGFRFNAAEGSGSIGATGTGDLDNGYVRGVKDEQ